jgi:hypothetical protein
LRNEELISSINVDLADFSMGMTIELPLLAYVNVGGRMRGTRPVCGYGKINK